MKKKKYTVFLGLILFALTILIFVTMFINSQYMEQQSNWGNVKPVPFDGYICGYENEKTFLQLPIFCHQNDNVDINNISSIVLYGDREFFCTNYLLSSFQNSEVEEYKLATLSFKVQLSEKGVFVFDHLKINLNDGKVIEWQLGNIEITVIDNNNFDDILSMTQFIVNQSDITNFRISYTNNTDDDIIIDKIYYPNDLFEGLQINIYTDFQLTSRESEMIIPPHEERTFLISLGNEGESGNLFYYILPFIYFEYDDSIIQMPAQTQATIVQAPFTKEFILDLMESVHEDVK